MYTAPANGTKLVHELLPRDLRHRTDLVELAENELRAMIDELSDEDRQRAWQLIGSAA